MLSLSDKTKEQLSAIRSSLNEDEIECALAWLNYDAGITGYGPGTVDEPDCPRPVVPEKVKHILDEWLEDEKKRRKLAFREACIEILGEDPEVDWT
jgi:hypothetical protein